MIWHLDDEHSLNSGPVSAVEVGKQIEWNIHCKQGVHFFDKTSKSATKIKCTTTFSASEGDLDFMFSLAS